MSGVATQAGPKGSDDDAMRPLEFVEPRDFSPTLNNLYVSSLEERKSPASSGKGASSEISVSDSGAQGARDEAGGDPLGTSDLLAQIARCLPSDLRPTLSFSTLVLSIGGDGALTAAPYVDATLPRITDEQTAAADRIVQAALQCGPYLQPNFKNRVISVVPDFSTIQPRVVSASVTNALSGGQTNRN